MGWTDRTPMGTRFLCPSRTAPIPIQSPVQGVLDLSRGYNNQGVVLTTHPLPVPILRMGWSSPLCLLRHIMGWPYAFKLLNNLRRTSLKWILHGGLSKSHNLCLTVCFCRLISFLPYVALPRNLAQAYGL